MAFPTDWSHYWQATPINPVETLSGFLAYIELSNLTGLGAIANSSGADIRISDISGNQMPCDVMPWYDGGTGILYLNINKGVVDESVRVWAGNPAAVFEDVTGTYGQYATYDSSIIAFYPSGNSGDRTSNQRHLTIGVAPSYGVGRNANHRSAIHDGVSNILTRTIVLGIYGDTYTVIGATYRSGTAQVAFTSQDNNGSRTDLRFGSNNRIQCYVDGAGGGAVTVNTSSGFTGNGHYVHGSIQSLNGNSRRAFINGGSSGSSTILQSPNTPQSISVGGWSDNGVTPNGYFSGIIQSVNLNTNLLSTGYLTYESQLQDNSAFWGLWTQFSNSTGGDTGITNVAIQGIVNVYTSSYDDINKNIYSYGESNTLTSITDNITKNIYPYVESHTYTSIIDSINNNVLISSESNTKTSATDNVVKNIYAYAESDTYTSLIDNISKSIYLYADSNTNTSIDGYQTTQDFSTPSGSSFTGWAGYDEIYIRNGLPTFNTTGQIYRINTSGFSNQWKSYVGASGQDIRVTTANGNRLPVDVISMESGNGYLEFNLTGNYPRDARERIRFWVGNTGATFEVPTSDYGQYNVYPANLYAYYPSGAGLDRTRNQNHLTGLNVTTGERYISTIPGSFYSGAYNYCDITGVTGVPFTMSAFFKTSAMTGNQVVMGLFNSEVTGNSYSIVLRGSTDSTTLSIRGNTSLSTVVGDDYVSNEWGNVVGTFTSNSLREIFNNGVSQGDGTTTITGTGINRLSIGAYGGLTQSGYANSNICFVELYSGVKNTSAILYDYTNTTNNISNTGWRPAFIPNNWSGYDEISIVHEASGNLYDQVYLLSTCLLSETLLTNCNSSGGDLRITKVDNVTELPIDVINFNQTQTGMLAFCWPGVKPSGQQDKIRVWAVNPSASMYPRTGVFGQYQVYNTGVLGFYPDGGGNDRTRYQKNMTGSNVTIGNLAGPLSGLKATNYSGINSCMSVVAFQSNIIRPLNISSIFWTDITSQNQVIAAAGASSASSRYNNAIRLNTSTGVAHHMDVSAGNIETIATSGFNISTWYAADAYNDNNITKHIHLNGRYQNSGSIAITFGIANFTIGGYSGTTSPATGSLLDGRVSLTAFDVATRYGYEPIYNHEMMFNHPNFYNNNGWTVYSSESSGETGVTNISFYGVINVYTNSFGYPFVNRSIYSISNIYTESINIPTVAKNLDSTSQTTTATCNSDYPFLAKNLAAISSTNTAIYGLVTSDGLTIVSVGGVVNVFTSSSAYPGKIVSVAGSSDTTTSSNGLPLKGINIAIESLTRTSSFGQVLKNVGLSGDSNTQTSSIATPIVDIIIGTASLSGESGTKTQAVAAVTVLISASAISEVRTMLEGYALNIGERTGEDNYEVTVYVNIENSEILYLCRNNEMPLFIAQGQSNNLII